LQNEVCNQCDETFGSQKAFMQHVVDEHEFKFEEVNEQFQTVGEYEVPGILSTKKVTLDVAVCDSQ
jgi:hypothetical protein